MRQFYLAVSGIFAAVLVCFVLWSPQAAAAAKPDVVVGTSATAGDGQITITFAKNKSGEYPDEYQIHWWFNSPNEDEAQYLPYVTIPSADVTEPTYSHTFRNLTNGKTFYFKVYAYKKYDNWSDRGQILTATPVAKPVITDAEKESRIKQSYQDAFGRAPDAGELKYWKSQTGWETYNDLIALHRPYIKGNDKVQNDIIAASYYATFWRGPEDAELKYWKGQLKSTGALYKELIASHNAYLKKDTATRNALIHNAFRTALGRDANATELKAWTAKIQSGEITSYSGLVSALRDALSGNTKVQADLVRSTYQIAFKRNETAAELKYWQGQITKSKLVFGEILNTHRSFIKQDKATRTDLIARSYTEVFGRKPDKGEAAFWEGRLKQYGLLYGEIVLAHKEWVNTNAEQLKKLKALNDALAKKGLKLNTTTGDIVNSKTGAVVHKEGQYFVGTTDAKGNIATVNGGAVLSTQGLTMVAAGGGNIVAAGGGNIVAAGGGNIVAAGGGNIVAAGGGNIVAAGGGNIVAAGGGNIVAAGGGNLNPGNLALFSGGTAMGVNR